MLNFTGVGSAFNTRLGNNSAWLLNGAHMMLIDCGSTVFERLMSGGVLKGVTKLDVCITHTHGDHVGSLGDLVLYCHFILGMQPVIRHPDGRRIETLLELLGVPQEAFTILDGEEADIDGWLKVNYIKQNHADTMYSYGLLMKYKDKTVWYSGDSRDVPASILSSFSAGEIDLFYQDTSGTDYPGALHMSIRLLEASIPKDLRKRVVCMHMDEAFNAEEAEALGFRYAVVGVPAEFI